jgi:acyl dehydratase
MTTTFTSLAELEAALGAPMGPTPWMPVDQKRIDAFADATGDHQWIHVDPARACAIDGMRGSPFDSVRLPQTSGTYMAYRD